MKSIREQFEEIWPVPEGVYWDSEEGEYMPREWRGVDEYMELSVEWDARLDTFNRCQETMALYVGIIDEMIADMHLVEDFSPINLRVIGIARESIGRAKQKLEQIK